MDNTERALFDLVIDKFQEQYPKRNIEIRSELYNDGDSYVYIDGRIMFCITGYNLLYNLQRLCHCLEGELI